MFAKGIGDPNFILVRNENSILVSDDVTNEIFELNAEGVLRLFNTSVNHPNGMAISKDGKTLYIAQIFRNIKPVVLDSRLWSIELVDGKPTGKMILAVEKNTYAGFDGLAMDELGRIYICLLYTSPSPRDA